jgi:cytidylate kinase
VARLLDDLGQGGQATAALGGFAPLAAEEANAPSADALRGLIRSAIEQTAARGSAVIVAHAASFALAGHESCLRVLVVASPETRRSRIAAKRGVDEREAGKLVQRSDAGRAAYLKRFYGVGAELPTHYDLVISTDRLTTDAAAALVVSAAAA